MQQEFLCALLL